MEWPSREMGTNGTAAAFAPASEQYADKDTKNVVSGSLAVMVDCGRKRGLSELDPSRW